MLHLRPNATTNRVVVSPYQARKFLATFTHYLVELKSEGEGTKYHFIPEPSSDNERYTRFGLATNSNDPTNGEILLQRSGLYTYKIWGQNSATNLDPTDESVVGICEVGACKVSDELPYTVPTITIPDNVIYYE